ncbi:MULTISPECIES: DUF485 domain-containing protein [Afipia]|uniref:Protein of uncharacterized function, DUF485 n=2 Tax=Afipia felis TaxID=1035 RepID=A0A380W309_AFIFE|nr:MULTISPECIES: DUF485 domain-containing protein [Afipia]EFI53290.1 protein of unknown function DUF485 [Afipia sp. 1NLS2]EKS30521.1 hypothetical protein HMPREF9697_03049 [Afipia felis ATCC 53690]SUU75266.1 Protein of uncharacterised function, DUF485 [Afipia felis]SUU83332.1 Protein of uncharacterised function, DUF485 [Afipia felis]
MDISVTAANPIDVPAYHKDSNWSAAYHDQNFQHLLRTKASRIRPAVLLYFLTYIVLSGLAGFAPQIMNAKLIGSFSIGYALILLTYFVAWGVALWYVRVAEVEFDPLKDAAVKSIHMREMLR